MDDEDLFIDFKLDLYSESPSNRDRELFELLDQYRPKNQRNRDNMKKGSEHETMPYFLTSQYAEILESSKL